MGLSGDKSEEELIKEIDRGMMEVDEYFRRVVQARLVNGNNWSIVDAVCWGDTGGGGKPPRCGFGAAVIDTGSEYRAFIVREYGNGRFEAKPVVSIPKSIRIMSYSCDPKVDCWSIIDEYGTHFFYGLDNLARYLGEYVHVPIRRSRNRAVFRHVLDTIAEVRKVKKGECPCGGNEVFPEAVDEWLSWDDIKWELANAYCCGYLGDCTQDCIRDNMGRVLIVIIPRDGLPDESNIIYVELHGTPPKAYAILKPSAPFDPTRIDKAIYITNIRILGPDLKHFKTMEIKDGYYIISLRELRHRSDIALYVLPSVLDVMNKNKPPSQ